MIILTGGAGFIGSVVLEKLNKMGIRNIVIVDSLKKTEKWKNLIGKQYSGYINKEDFLHFLNKSKNNLLYGYESYKIYSQQQCPKKELNYIEAIIHLGACSTTTEKDAEYIMKNNYEYSKQLAKYCIKNNIRYIYASSAATYGDGSLGFEENYSLINSYRPLNLYGYSKQIMDEWIINEGLEKKVVGLKFFNVYGPNEYHKKGQYSVIYSAYNRIKETGEMQLFKSNNPKFLDGEQMRDFVYVKDVSNVIYWLLKNNSVNGIFNLGSGTARTWNDLVKAVFNAMNKPCNINYIKIPDNLKKQYQNYTKADMKLLSKYDLLKSFHSLEEGVTDYIKNYLTQENPYL